MPEEKIKTKVTWRNWLIKKLLTKETSKEDILNFIAKEEKISISEKELTDGMIHYASQYSGQEKQILEYFKKNPSSIESIKGPLLEQKVIDNILSKAKLSKHKLTIEAYNKLQEKVFKITEED